MLTKSLPLVLLSFVAIFFLSGYQNQSSISVLNQLEFITPVSASTHRIPSSLPVSETLIHLKSNTDFNGFLKQAPGRVLVDFYADWCEPCKTQSKILREASKAIKTQNAMIIKINVDRRPELVDQFRVSSIPTLLVFEKGEVIKRQEGLADSERVSALLQQ